jgi:hypothetical protein
MAELLNTFFGSVFTREDTNNITTAADMETGDMADVNITLSKVKKNIRNLKASAAALPDSIGPRLLQELANEIAPVLVITFRRSLEFGEVLDDWRNANVTPIFKKGSKADP